MHTARAGNRLVNAVAQDEITEEDEVCEGKGELSGYRFFDMAMLSHMLETSFTCATCTDEMIRDQRDANITAADWRAKWSTVAGGATVTSERRNGLASCLTLTCSHGHEHHAWTSPDALEIARNNDSAEDEENDDKEEDDAIEGVDNEGANKGGNEGRNEEGKG